MTALAKLRTILAGVAMLAGATVMANAATLTVTDTLSTGSGTLSVAGFDDMGGDLILTSVDITLSASLSVSADFNNDSPEVADVSLKGSFTVFIMNTSFSASLPNVSGTDTQTLSLPAGAATTLIATATGSATTSITTDLFEFLAPESILVDYGMLRSVSASCAPAPCGISPLTIGEYSVTLAVTYNYEESDSLEPVPLPAGGFLLLTGLATAAGLGYRKKRAA